MLQLPDIEAATLRRRTTVRIPAQVAAGDAVVLAAFRQLEFGLADLVQMTSIAGTLVESYGSEAIAAGKRDITAEQAVESLKKTGDQLMFMVYEIEQKALALDKEWHAAAAAGDFTFDEVKDDLDSGDEKVEILEVVMAERDRWKRLALSHEKDLASLRASAQGPHR
jgi:hypothetical protein